MRKDSQIPAILALWDANPDGWLTGRQIVEGIGSRCANQLQHLLAKQKLYILRMCRHSRYFRSAEAMEAHRPEWEQYTSPEAKLARRKAQWRSYEAKQRLSQEVKDARAAARDAAKAKAAKDKAARVAARTAEFTAPNRSRINPDLRKQSHAQAWRDAEPYIPPGVTVQVLPGFERFECPVRARLAMR